MVEPRSSVVAPAELVCVDFGELAPAATLDGRSSCTDKESNVDLIVRDRPVGVCGYCMLIVVDPILAPSHIFSALIHEAKKYQFHGLARAGKVSPWNCRARD